jgi:hypothetical protein
VLGAAVSADARVRSASVVRFCGASADVTGTGVHPNTSPDITLTATQLETNYGLSTTDATAVSNAEFGNGSVAPTAVEVSVDGKVIVNVNQGKGASNEAIATSGAKDNDISIAIGGGTKAVSNDTATATNGGAAILFNAGSSSASATGADSIAQVAGVPTNALDPNSPDGVYNIPGYTTESSGVDNNGTTTTVNTSDTNLLNGAPAPAEAHLEASIPLAAHVEPSIPLP